MDSDLYIAVAAVVPTENDRDNPPGEVASPGEPGLDQSSEEPGHSGHCEPEVLGRALERPEKVWHRVRECLGLVPARREVAKSELHAPEWPKVSSAHPSGQK
eukprot:1177925-Prorocentrum_minimum.AAC.1